ncbi:hypothetical protein K7X08_016735 [Anisodus acutangulus]|uniref:Oxidative stress 3 n=1 Tax=Anisodus acutangulus TaxID=402998 RepID=A0A9Q1LT79_9SOLA|nr:hypothetical protein K7X08_016735 [Anisodus acutangulus]
MEGTKAVKSPRQVQWVVMETVNSVSAETCSCIDMVDDDDDDDDDDASSSSSSFGPLYELSELMAQLPIKKGLSKYYQGKSQSYGHLGSVMSLKDLAKEGNSYNKRMKLCKSLDGRKRSSFAPKSTITKKFYSRRPIISNTLVGRSPISLE